MATVRATSSRAPVPFARLFLRLQRFFQTLLIPFLAIVTALIIGAILILLAGRNPVDAYEKMVDESLAQPDGLVASLLNTAPLILVGLSVGFAFKAGLFNIGAQGQLVMGSIASAWTGVTFTGLPAEIHIPLVLFAGFTAGALWGAIPGALKAFTDAHEVITTIMLNSVAALLAQYLLSSSTAEGEPGPLNHRDPSEAAISGTKWVEDSARLPIAFSVPPNVNLHVGIFIAVTIAILILVIINRSTFGFELRMVGANPTAARYAGINIKGITIWAMAIAGGLAGLAGTIETIGRYGRYETTHSGGLGFDGITVSLLAGNNPIGIVFSAFLFGVMDEGRRTIGRGDVAVQSDLTDVIQALILMFVAAPQIIQYIYRLKLFGSVGQRLGASWGKKA